MKKLNVVDLGEFKELREIRKTEHSYGLYLKTLANSQLETEINGLLEEYQTDSYGKEFFCKGKLILKEISFRSTGSVKTKIELMNDETLKLL
jgi:hypothetical protein